SHRDGPAWSHPRMDDPAGVRPRGLLRRASRSPGLDLWIEGRVNDNGYGTVLKQVPWRHGTTLDQEDPRACDHLPVPGAREYTCAIDHQHGRMAIAYWSGVDKRVAVLPLEEVLRGRVPDPIADFSR